MAPSGAFFVGDDLGLVGGYDPLLQNDVPVRMKLLPDIAENDTLFGDEVPSYIDHLQLIE